MVNPLLNPAEQKAIDALAEAWNLFIALPELHPWDQREFMHAINAAQRVILSRPALREAAEHKEDPK